MPNGPQPTAFVMNMFYTGLGVARSLGEQGIPVIGLSSHPGVYGEYTRYAKIVSCPDSRNEPAALARFLEQMGRTRERRGILFPTRDEDVLFLDRYREQLAPFFDLVVPESSVLRASLSKWETYLWAQKAGVATPRSWLIEGEQDLARAIPEVRYPCVLKPVESWDWRSGVNWQKVGQRKALSVSSREELLAEYEGISRAAERVLLQEMVVGGDDCLVITACYMDRNSNLVAAFNTRKLLQIPEGFGTGCIVQAADYPELLEPTARLLKTMRFTGIAEVEYKWDAIHKQYQLIEVNPRPWDQHRLGNSCGVNLMHLAYCDHAGLPIPPVSKRRSDQKWIADDTFVMTTLRFLWKRDPKLGRLFRLARGRRCYAIWSAKDPLPSIVFMIGRFLPALIANGVNAVWSKIQGKLSGRDAREKKGGLCEEYLEKGKSRS